MICLNIPVFNEISFLIFYRVNFKVVSVLCNPLKCIPIIVIARKQSVHYNEILLLIKGHLRTIKTAY